MNGIGLVIPGADFSGSPLGKVTVAKSSMEVALEIVDEYTTLATGISSTEPLVNFVSGMVEAGVWDFVKAFYPMMGSSLVSKLVELKEPDNINKNLWNAYNFENTDKGIFVDNGIDAGFPFTANEMWHYNIAFKDVAMATAFKLNSLDTQHIHPILLPNEYSDIEGIEDALEFNSNSVPCSLRTTINGIEFGGAAGNASNIVSQNSVKGIARRCEFWGADSGFKLQVDGGSVLSSTVSNMDTRSRLNIYPIIGNEMGSSTNGREDNIDKTSSVSGTTRKRGQIAFWGDFYAFAFLDLNGLDDEDRLDKMAAFDELFGAFLHDSGKIL